MNELNLIDVLEVCSQFLSDPQNAKNQEALADLKSKLIIKKFLPLYQKDLVVTKTFLSMSVDDAESSGAAIALEIALLFNVLLAYTNIDINVPLDMQNSAYYDMLIMSGIADHVLSYCKEDYERTEKIAMNMISFENLKTLVATLSKMDTASIEGLTREFKRFTLETNPESLRNLADIMRQNDPLYTSIKEGVMGTAYEAARSAFDDEETEKTEN